jgi:high affinity Mn2+ porin
MLVRELLAASAVLLGLVAPCRAADGPVTMTGKVGAFDWSGAYVGTELGYAAGFSDWSAAQVGSVAPIFSGSIGLSHGYDPFDGDGSYFGGLDAGYNYVFPSRLFLGVEGDVSFPNSISGSQTVSSDVAGRANYADTVLLFATARGRIGYAFEK